MKLRVAVRTTASASLSLSRLAFVFVPSLSWQIDGFQKKLDSEYACLLQEGGHSLVLRRCVCSRSESAWRLRLSRPAACCRFLNDSTEFHTQIAHSVHRQLKNQFV
jgi:hypothetical protein